MINQQVNLFQPIFRKERKLLSFRALIQACSAVLVVLIIMYAWSVQQTQQLEADLIQLKKQQTHFSRQLTEVSARLAGIKTDTAPQLTLASLEQELSARQKVIVALTRVKDSYTHGISNYLDSFSRQTPDGVWLTGFTVQAGGEGLVIRGSALKAALVPTFLQKLSDESTLKGTSFGLLKIQRKEPDTHFVDFTVYTGTKPPPISDSKPVLMEASS